MLVDATQFWSATLPRIWLQLTSFARPRCDTSHKLQCILNLWMCVQNPSDLRLVWLIWDSNVSSCKKLNLQTCTQIFDVVFYLCIWTLYEGWSLLCTNRTQRKQDGEAVPCLLLKVQREETSSYLFSGLRFSKFYILKQEFHHRDKWLLMLCVRFIDKDVNFHRNHCKDNIEFDWEYVNKSQNWLCN